mmetsp:Transcript_5274/g.8452  ORF Transcript_5274/g.8452 Transcript_5274/m.8452 type:complete len:137 (+) Transcript_5274:2-412(+)
MGDADRLPMANVSRIIASELPKDASVSKEARVALSACATVFVHYITELAIQQCDKRKKVTLAPEDIIEAVKEAEFEDFEDELKQALEAFRNQNKKAASSSNKKQKTEDPNLEALGPTLDPRPEPEHILNLTVRPNP